MERRIALLDYLEITIRILVAMVLGGLIGLEREYQNQPAGLRTHIILVVGSTLTTILAIQLPYILPAEVDGDMMRLVSGVITGIGFLGGGAILRLGANVKGLTTATSLWTMAVVGLAIGAGLYFPAVLTSAILLLVLVGLSLVEDRWIQPFINLNITLSAKDHKGILDKIKKTVAKYGSGSDHTRFSVEKNMKKNELAIDISLRTRQSNALELLIKDLAHIDGVQSFEIN
jgi:putative Mg2+ transporter-C (MgtC) family protein